MAELYHYTTGAGLLGMLKDYDADKNPNLTMWATHYAYMNDPTELEFGKEICLPLIKEIEKENEISYEKRIYPIITYEQYKEINRDQELLAVSFPQYIALFCPYIISFSKNKDSLHMWNMYGQNGNGLALCFDKKDINYPSLNSCWYLSDANKSRYKKEIKQVLRSRYMSAMSSYSSIFPKDVREKKELKAYIISSYMYASVASYIKNKAYAEEQEWRIIAHNADKILSRERNGEIVPYVEQKIPFDALKYIIVGPTRDFERTCYSILLLLGQNGISWSPDKIIQSKVPYRG